VQIHVSSLVTYRETLQGQPHFQSKAYIVTLEPSSETFFVIIYTSFFSLIGDRSAIVKGLQYLQFESYLLFILLDNAYIYLSFSVKDPFHCHFSVAFNKYI
jgi:hypothetical protein